MMEVTLMRADLAARIERLVRGDGAYPTAIPRLTLGRISRVHLVHAVCEPALCVIAQRSKRRLLGDEVYVYDTSHYLVFAQTCRGRLAWLSGSVPAKARRSPTTYPAMGRFVEVEPHRQVRRLGRCVVGSVSGVVNVAHQLGGSLGLLVLVVVSSVATSRNGTDARLELSHRVATALSAGAGMLALALLIVLVHTGGTPASAGAK